MYTLDDQKSVEMTETSSFGDIFHRLSDFVTLIRIIYLSRFYPMYTEQTNKWTLPLVSTPKANEFCNKEIRDQVYY